MHWYCTMLVAADKIVSLIPIWIVTNVCFNGSSGAFVGGKVEDFIGFEFKEGVKNKTWKWHEKWNYNAFSIAVSSRVC